MAHPQSTRERTVSRLLAAQDEHGHIPDAAVEKAAALAGTTTRSVRRWIQDSDQWQNPNSRTLDDELIAEALTLAGNNCAKAYRILQAEGHELPSERTFRRQVANHHKQLRIYLEDGEEGLRQSQLYTRWEAPHHNHTWQTDHDEVPVHVLPRGCSKARKPYLTAYIDDATRMCMGFGVDFRGRGGTGMIVAVLAKAVQIRPTLVAGKPVPAGEVGGAPLFVRHDQGADYTSRKVSDVLAAFDIERSEAIGYSPWLKGKVERFFRTANDDFFAQLPGYSGAGSDHKGRSILTGSESGLLTDDEFLARLTAWVRYYNHVRPHRSIGGRAPFEAWMDECHSPLRPVSHEALQIAMLPVRGTRRVQKDGIHHNNDIYFSPDLPAVGTDTRIRHLPHDEQTIEVYVDDQWVCTAYRHADLTPAQRQATYSRRGRESRNVRRAASNGRLRRSLDVYAMPTDDPQDVPVATGQDVKKASKPASKKAEKTRPAAKATPAGARRRAGGSALLELYDSTGSQP